MKIREKTKIGTPTKSSTASTKRATSWAKNREGVQNFDDFEFRWSRARQSGEKFFRHATRIVRNSTGGKTSSAKRSLACMRTVLLIVLGLLIGLKIGVYVGTPDSLEEGYEHGTHCMDMNVF